MDSAIPRHLVAREASLTNRIGKLRLARVAAFLVGGGAVAIGGWALVAAGVAAVGFVVLVILHGRLITALRLIQTRATLAQRLDAAARLDWNRIPTLRAIPEPDRCALDLGLFEGRSLLRVLDVTATKQGAKKLADLLRSDYVPSEEVRRRQERVRRLERLHVPRRRFLVAASELEGQIDTDGIGERITKPFAASRHRVLVPSLIFLHIAFAGSLIAGYGGAPGPWRWIVPAVFFALVGTYRAVRKQVPIGEAYQFAEALDSSVNGVRRILPTVQRLLARLDGATEERELALGLRALEKATSALAVRQNYLAHMSLNALFPWDAWWTIRLESARAGLAEILPRWFERCAELEAFLAVAEFGAVRPTWHFPELHETGAVLVAKQLAHPCLPAEGRIANDLQLGGDGPRCILLSGSNMSGKSTWLRAIGLNLLLAKAGSRVCATQFDFRSTELATSIHLVDSLEQGLSLFLAEVRKLKNTLDAARGAVDTRPVVYLVDELFRGTNHKERVAAASAYLSALAETRAFGLVTSHDAELVTLEGKLPGLENWHLQEEWDGTRPVFRYLLRRGPATTTNALRIVRGAGLPAPESA